MKELLASSASVWLIDLYGLFNIMSSLFIDECVTVKNLLP